MRFFCSGEKLNKKYLINKTRGNPIYAPYTPDLLKYNKAFLLNLIAYLDLDPQLFKTLYAT